MIVKNDKLNKMTVKNLTQNTIITKNCKHATTLMEITFGLHWISNPPELLFKTRYGIHTLSLKKSIDVLILDDQFKVQALKQNLLPNQFFFWNPKFQWVLELPAGVISQTGTKLQNQLNFDPKPQT